MIKGLFKHKAKAKANAKKSKDKQKRSKNKRKHQRFFPFRLMWRYLKLSVFNTHLFMFIKDCMYYCLLIRVTVCVKCIEIHDGLKQTTFSCLIFWNLHEYYVIHHDFTSEWSHYDQVLSTSKEAYVWSTLSCLLTWVHHVHNVYIYCVVSSLFCRFSCIVHTQKEASHRSSMHKLCLSNTNSSFMCSQLVIHLGILLCLRSVQTFRKPNTNVIYLDLITSRCKPIV